MRNKLSKISIRYAGIFILTVFILASCNNRNTSKDENNRDLLVTRISSPQQLIVFDYDSINRPERLIFNETDTLLLKYDSLERIVSDGYNEYEYRENLILKTSIYFEEVDTLVINDKNQLITILYDLTPNTGKVNDIDSTSFEYDSTGNVIRKIQIFQYTDDKGTDNQRIVQSVSEESFTYDDKKGVISGITNNSLRTILSGMNWFKYMNNNIATGEMKYRKYMNDRLIDEKDNTYKYNYTYDNSGYPVSATDETGESTFTYKEMK